jgi:prepilin-type N-terminal cleavage/methylation domain-containing protein
MVIRHIVQDQQAGQLGSQHRTVLRASGFSLVELVVVIGIIALLMGILIPTISRARDGARRVTCMSNMRQLTVAWTEYATHHDGNLVSSDTNKAGDWVIGGNTRSEIENGVLFPYCPHADIYHCPADYSDHWRSFSINAYFNSPSASPWKIPTIHRLDETRRPAETFVFVEEFDPRPGSNLNSFVMLNSGNTWVDYPTNFHGNGCTVGFADDHAEFWVYADERTKQIKAANTTQANNPDLVRFQKAVGF